LVEINPQHASKKRDRRNQRQEQKNSPHRGFSDPPPGNGPEKPCKERDDRQSNRVTDVHGPEEIPRLALVPKIANRAAFIHFRKAQKDGVMKNSPYAAPRTPVMNNVIERRKRARLHETASV